MTPELRGTWLYDAHVDLGAPLMVGPTPEGVRAIFPVTGGTLAGPRLKGRFLPQGGGDWARIRPDGSVALDVRALVETDDGALIHLTYGGRIIIPPDLQGRVLDIGNPEPVDPSLYYFRVLPLFETASPAYAWLNGICAVGIGRVVTGGVAYRVYAID